MPNIRWLLALITAIHRFVYVRSGGWIGHNLAGRHMLLLDNVGRRSGVQRKTPLLYVRDGERLVVVASNAGDERTPDWWRNLEAQPETHAQIARRRMPVRARRATPREEERLWPLLEASYRSYARYREHTVRVIPVVILEPRAGA